MRIAPSIARVLRPPAAGAGARWIALGMAGLAVWSVAMPTLLGAALGLWLDESWPRTHSWTLLLLLAGLALGALNAWHWRLCQRRAMHAGPPRDDD
ncbi:AtpZ/AtpI family protein [Derxia lacustris]|uniref:AtpZ/AtpI family protein n=1 Tax=Derxia lacustris TaxID=764842 RepID=UPI000A171A1E|nr:AtpZ/AtpI family protein [Derxia lacustris]